MGKVQVLILRAPGTNCDTETATAFQLAGAETSLVHINQLIRGDRQLSDYQVMVIPGGFTYGDDISAGKVLANELKTRLRADMKKFTEEGKLTLGICNGFQVLLKAGILPELSNNSLSPVTLLTNDSGKFECRWVHLSVSQNTPCVFTRGITHMYLPVAHGEGKFVADQEALLHLNKVLQYSDELGNTNAGYPHNPNGSAANIAGICDASGRIFALMPHPERHIYSMQHPAWTRHKVKGYGDGFQIFVNAVEYAQQL